MPKLQSEFQVSNSILLHNVTPVDSILFDPNSDRFVDGEARLNIINPKLADQAMTLLEGAEVDPNQLHLPGAHRHDLPLVRKRPQHLKENLFRLLKRSATILIITMPVRLPFVKARELMEFCCLIWMEWPRFPILCQFRF